MFGSRHSRSERVTAWCDFLITTGLVLGIAFAPFAFGAVHPQAYGLLETIAGFLFLVAVLRFGVGARPRGGWSVPSRSLCLAMAGFLGLVALQLVPLPPSTLRVVSPSTYDLYVQALPGWPEKAPYEGCVYFNHINGMMWDNDLKRKQA